MKKVQKIIIIYIFFLSSICIANQSENLQKLKYLYENNIITEVQYIDGVQKILLNSEEMIKLNDLFEKGILTEKQFNEAKAVLQPIDPGIEGDPNPPPVVDPTDPNPPPILSDPTVLQPIDPGIEYPPETLPGADPKKVPDLVTDPNPTDPMVAVTKQEKKDTEILRRASEGDFSDYVKKELAGAATRLGVTAPKEEDFSQDLQIGSSGKGQTGQSGDGTTNKKTSSPTDPNPPPKIPEEGNFAPESMSNDPRIESAPGEGQQEPNACNPCPE